MRKTIALCALALLALSSSAVAGSRAWVSEFTTISIVGVNTQAQMMPLPAVADSGPLDLSTGAKSVTVSASTKGVRICVEVQVGISNSGTATINSMPQFAGTCEYYGVQANSTVSIIAAP